MNHKHKWKKTGGCRYSCPLQFEYKCMCGKIKWVEDPSTGIKKLTEKEARKWLEKYEYNNSKRIN